MIAMNRNFSFSNSIDKFNLKKSLDQVNSNSLKFYFLIINENSTIQVRELSMNYGSKHVILRLKGFKPDFFATLADAIATECAFLSEVGTTHTPTNTFKVLKLDILSIL